MARGDPQIVSFAAGELSPLARGRVDVDRYAAACRSLVNFIVTPQGGIVHRWGTQYLAGSHGGLKTLLLPFVANTGNEFVLEIGDTTARVWYGPGRQLVFDNAGTWNVNNLGVIGTIVTPWLATHLFDTDGTPRVKAVQVNDVMWLVHPLYYPYKITRVAEYKFQGQFIGDGINASSPFKDVNPNETVTLTASAAIGAGVTITASAPTFVPGDVGGWLYLERPKVDNTPPWETAKAVVIGDVRSSVGRYYGAVNAATTGTVRPTHSLGTRIDGVGGVSWEWHDDGYGILAITGFTSTTQIVGTVVRRLPNTVVSTGTTRWARQAWNAVDGYPAAIALYRERLCFGRGQTVWTSVAGDFENFQFQDGGQQTPDMAITLTFGASRNDRIKWLAAIKGLLMAGTASSEFAIGPQSSADPFGPANVFADPVGGNGCNGLQPVPVADSMMFVERTGRRVREARFNIDVDGLSSRDVNIFADHIFTRGTCAGLAHQRIPFGVLWSTTTGGALKGFTFQSEQNVWAWHTHVLGGDGFGLNLKPAVRSLASIAGPDAVNDDLWLVVERDINGVLVYYVEVLGTPRDHSNLGYVTLEDHPNVRDSAFMDCQVQRFLPAVGTTTIASLSHLNSEMVGAVVDGEYRPPRLVTGAAITIPATTDTCRAWVGFVRDADVIPVPLTGAPVAGTPQGKKARISHIKVRVKDSLNFVAGKPGGTLDRWLTRNQAATMSAATPLESGDFEVLYSSGSTEDAERPEVLVRQDQPFPLIVLGIFPRLTVEGA